MQNDSFELFWSELKPNNLPIDLKETMKQILIHVGSPFPPAIEPLTQTQFDLWWKTLNCVYGPMQEHMKDTFLKAMIKHNLIKKDISIEPCFQIFWTQLLQVNRLYGMHHNEVAIYQQKVKQIFESTMIIETTRKTFVKNLLLNTRLIKEIPDDTKQGSLTSALEETWDIIKSLEWDTERIKVIIELWMGLKRAVAIANMSAYQFDILKTEFLEQVKNMT